MSLDESMLCKPITTKEENMARESKHRKDQRKKPSLTLKERRARKQEKKQHKVEHFIENPNLIE